MPNCYTVQAFATAYGFSIWLCGDKSTWARVISAPKVLPPHYEKKVGRLTKSRRKQPHEVKGKEVSKMTRHGLEIHCSHCKESGHNSIGWSLKKKGLKPKQMLKRNAPPPQSDNAEEHVLIQVLTSCYQFIFDLLSKLICWSSFFNTVGKAQSTVQGCHTNSGTSA